MTTVIYHSADWDGRFCGQIAHKCLPDAKLIGWDFGDPVVFEPPFGHGDQGTFWVLDLPLDAPFGLKFKDGWAMRGSEQIQPLDRIDFSNVRWLDHHFSAIESHPKDILGFRMDGVAACRLCWQWFIDPYPGENPAMWAMPEKDMYIFDQVDEPLAVRLVGKHDVWDHADPRAKTFQFGLNSRELDATDWKILLDYGDDSERLVKCLLADGALLQEYQKRTDAGIVTHKSWLLEWEGLKFLCLNTARFNSLTFEARDVPETGHDALLGFSFDGTKYTVSLYHANHRTDLDLSEIAKRHGGGGHRGACGFVCSWPPFLTPPTL